MISVARRRYRPSSKEAGQGRFHHGRASDLRARKAQQRSSSSSGGGVQGPGKRGSKSSLLPGGSRDNTMPLLASYGVRLPTMKHIKLSISRSLASLMLERGIIQAVSHSPSRSSRQVTVNSPITLSMYLTKWLQSAQVRTCIIVL